MEGKKFVDNHSKRKKLTIKFEHMSSAQIQKNNEMPSGTSPFQSNSHYQRNTATTIQILYLGVEYIVWPFSIHNSISNKKAKTGLTIAFTLFIQYQDNDHGDVLSLVLSTWYTCKFFHFCIQSDFSQLPSAHSFAFPVLPLKQLMHSFILIMYMFIDDFNKLDKN